MTPSRFLLAMVMFGASVPVALACIQTGKVPSPKKILRWMAGVQSEAVKGAKPAALDPVKLDLSLNEKKAEGSREDYAKVVADYEAHPAQHTSYEDRNDYAASLIFLGRAGDAIPVLQRLEADFTGKYATAANLGTAYELVDDLPNARKWIALGLERNPASHEGTEWLHLAILEAKMQLKKDPNWLASHAVLEKEHARDREAVAKALEYQLNERLFFIKENDPVMCDLFYEAARIASDSVRREYFMAEAKRFANIRDSQLTALAAAR